ncbi:MAG: hypothetical protein ACFHWZ_15230 [Phycisphaerales bacterium]
MITSLSSQPAPEPQRRRAGTTDPVTQDARLSQTLMELAAAIEAQELRIKGVLLAAAEAGDLELVRKVLGLWINGPVSSVIAELEATEGVQHQGVPPREEVQDAGSGDVPRIDRAPSQ